MLTAADRRPRVDELRLTNTATEPAFYGAIAPTGTQVTKSELQFAMEITLPEGRGLTVADLGFSSINRIATRTNKIARLANSLGVSNSDVKAAIARHEYPDGSNCNADTLINATVRLLRDKTKISADAVLYTFNPAGGSRTPGNWFVVFNPEILRGAKVTGIINTATGMRISPRAYERVKGGGAEPARGQSSTRPGPGPSW